MGNKVPLLLFWVLVVYPSYSSFLFISQHQNSQYEQLKKKWEYGIAPKTPNTSWPSIQPEENEIPKLRNDLIQCDMKLCCKIDYDSSICDKIQFDLGTSLVSLPWDENAVKEGTSL